MMPIYRPPKTATPAEVTAVLDQVAEQVNGLHRLVFDMFDPLRAINPGAASQLTRGFYDALAGAAQLAQSQASNDTSQPGRCTQHPERPAVGWQQTWPDTRVVAMCDECWASSSVSLGR